MDTTWPFNLDCVQLSRNTPAYYDKLIIPSIFYNAVVTKNVEALINVVKYNPKLSIAVIAFYNLILQQSFYYKKAGKAGIPYRIQWKTNKPGPIIINYDEQSELYKYMTTAPPLYTNMGFLVNTINGYLVQLRIAMTYINNKVPALAYYKLGVNITNNVQMKRFISQFIPGIPSITY
jgi:hypothetical protein